MSDIEVAENTPLLQEKSTEKLPFSWGPSEQPPKDETLLARIRRVAHENVEGTIDSPLEYIILALIFGNVVLLAVSTIPINKACFGKKCMRLGEKYNYQFEIVELVSVIIFTFEYVLRIWTCIEFHEIAVKGPILGRLHYATSFFPLVDILSIAPYWIAIMAGGESPDFTTAVRIFRLIRLLKADKYLNAFSLLGDVLKDNSNLLIASSFYALLTWIVSATALHVVEIDNPALGTHFQSIPQALFPVLLMLTGEFPMADFTALGQVIAGVIAVVAVAIFAVPSALLASGFIKAVQQSTGREFTVDID